MVYVKGRIEGVDVTALLDSGSNVLLIAEELRMSIPVLHKHVLHSQYVVARGLNGHLLDIVGMVSLPIQLSRSSFVVTVHVLQGATQ